MELNSPSGDQRPSIAHNGLEIYFFSDRLALASARAKPIEPGALLVDDLPIDAYLDDEFDEWLDQS